MQCNVLARKVSRDARLTLHTCCSTDARATMLHTHSRCLVPLFPYSRRAHSAQQANDVVIMLVTQRQVLTATSGHRRALRLVGVLTQSRKANEQTHNRYDQRTTKSSTALPLTTPRRESFPPTAPEHNAAYDNERPTTTVTTANCNTSDVHVRATKPTRLASGVSFFCSWRKGSRAH